MLNYPTKAKVKDRIYEINTDFRVALECDEISRSSVPDEERTLAIIYKLFGEEGLNNTEDWEDLIEIAVKYLKCGKENEDSDSKEANMSYEQDMGYIESSFFSDYNIDLSKVKMHYWQFYNLLCGLTEDSALNRIRYVRDFDISQIKDAKERAKWIEQKKQVALKREKTAEEKRLDDLFEKQLKGG